MAWLYDIQLDQGTDDVKGFEFYDHDRRPLTFDGYTAHMQVRRTASSDVIVDELKSDGENPRITFDTNIISLHFSREVTSSIKAGRYCYDLEITSEDGYVYRMLEGAFVIRREVTR